MAQKIFVKRGNRIHRNEGYEYEKLDDIEVTFNCKGGPIGEVGTFDGTVSYTINFARYVYSVVSGNKINKVSEMITLTNDEENKIMALFSNDDFNPDDSQDLTIDEPECNGIWTDAKIVCVYKVTPSPKKDKKDMAEPRDAFEFYF
jgi:hypothetical protein